MTQNSHVLDSPAAKVLAVLSTVARLQAAPVSAIAQELGLPVATAHRICVELERLGYIRRVAGSRQWSVAKPLVDLASTILSAGASEAATHAILNRITHQTGEMCSFAVQVGDEVVYVASTEAPHTVTVSFRAGRRAPLFCTSSGRLFLSRLSDKAVMHYLEGVHLAAYTPYTLTAPKKLMTVIRRTREQGYVITNQEYVLHVVGAAVPIEDEHGLFYGALSLAAPDVRQSPISLEKLIPSLSDTGAELAKICELNACPAPSRGPSRLQVRL